MPRNPKESVICAGGTMRGHQLRAESLVRVSADFAELIRQTQLKESFKTFNHLEDDIMIIDVHNSIVHYVKNIMISQNTNCIDENGHYLCCDLMRRLYRKTLYDPTDIRAKWRMIIRNLRTIDGNQYEPSNRSINISNASPASGQIIAPREYEPAPINPQRESVRENVMRKKLEDYFVHLDGLIKTMTSWNVVEKVDQPKSAFNRWHYNPDSYKRKGPTEESENEAKRFKPQLAEEDTCVICLEAERTHAFLHIGLSRQDATSHFVACEECANSCRWADNGCPVCRMPCINVIRVLK